MGKNKPAKPEIPDNNPVDETPEEVIETPSVVELTDEQKMTAALAPHRARLLARRRYATSEKEFNEAPTWTPRHLRK